MKYKDKQPSAENTYYDFLERIKSSTKSTDAYDPVESEESGSESARETSIRKRLEDVARRSEVTSGLNMNYMAFLLERFQTKETLKKSFYKITMGILIVALLFIGLILFRITANSVNSLEGLAAFVTALGGGLTALLVLPRIIADYLFNKEEDIAVVKWLSEMVKQGSPELDEFLPKD